MIHYIFCLFHYGGEWGESIISGKASFPVKFRGVEMLAAVVATILHLEIPRQLVGKSLEAPDKAVSFLLCYLHYS